MEEELLEGDDVRIGAIVVGPSAVSSSVSVEVCELVLELAERLVLLAELLVPFIPLDALADPDLDFEEMDAASALVLAIDSDET